MFMILSWFLDFLASIALILFYFILLYKWNTLFVITCFRNSQTSYLCTIFIQLLLLTQLLILLFFFKFIYFISHSVSIQKKKVFFANLRFILLKRKSSIVSTSKEFILFDTERPLIYF